MVVKQQIDYDQSFTDLDNDYNQYFKKGLDIDYY